ncbi:MAG: type VI secretion system Vgr family protein [Paracoccaceae bacterium]
MVFKQANRLGKLHTSLGPDALVLLRFNGTDQINGLSTYQIEALSTETEIDFDALIGSHATVEIATKHGSPVFFDGIVANAQWAGVGENGVRYDLTLRPWLWLANHRRNQRIFHDRTVVEILKELFAPYLNGGAELKDKLTETYPKLEYTVQYRESDMDFATRMMERFGISYHFTHAMQRHTLVMTDAIDAHDPVPGGKRPFLGVKRHHQNDEEHFWEFQPERRITTGAMRLIDYNFKKPTQAMEVDKTGDAAHANGKIESFDYPGDYLDQGQGKGVVGLRTRQERGDDARARAVGDTISLRSGLKVTLNGDRIPGATGESFLCLSAVHSYVSDSYGSGGHDSDEFSYSGRYVLMPAKSPLAPDRKSPQPVVQGPQTAVVVGEGEIDCDEYGRILVKFHWDLASAYSMRCRVSQVWSGQGWGGVVIPRIGMEVVVEFLEGDPDKPLVTGCVYNGKNGTPYQLPAHKTKSVLRSDTHQGTGFNEFTFEDEKGEENMFFHAQKDQTTRILNNRTARVDQHDVYSVGGNRAIEVAKNQKHEIGGSFNLTVGGTGGGALAALAGVAGLAGQTAGLLTQAGAVAGGGGAILGAFSATLGSSALGFLSGGGLGSRDGVIAGPNPGADAGKALAASGAGMGEDAKGLFPMPGIMNTVVQSFQSTSVGVAQVDQVGVSKVTNVGLTSMETVGKAKKLVVGDEYSIEVGKASMVMQKDGTIIIKGVRFHFEAAGHFQQLGKVIDLN